MNRRGFTLVEVITVMLIMSLSAVVVMPVVSVLLTRIDDSQTRRSASASVHTALDQVAQTVRSWPVENGQLTGVVAYRDAGELVGLEISGAGGFRLDSGTLRLIDATGDEGVLCEAVDTLSLQVLGSGSDEPLVLDEDLVNGVTVRVSVEAGGVTGGAVVFVRSMTGVGSVSP